MIINIIITIIINTIKLIFIACIQNTRALKIKNEMLQ